MKKLISLGFFVFAMLVAKAQTANETLEWLRAKQPAIRCNCVSFDETTIRISEKEEKVTIQWSKIKDITSNLLAITIVSDEVIDGKNVFIRFYIDGKIIPQYAKALKHLAELKGAKFVKDDMF
jgi:hypothetical protein